MSFREGLEAFLVVVILLKFIDKIDNKILKKSVWHGLSAGLAISLIFGMILRWISSYLGGMDATAKMWESSVSFVTTVLVTTFVIWMIKHGSKIKDYVEGKAALNLSRKGMFLITMLMVVREGVEIVLFQFAGKYPLSSILSGVAIAVGIVTLIYYSLVKIKVQTIFKITLAYLILQTGFLFGYSIHEGLSAFKEIGVVAGSHPVFAKAYDLTTTIFNHKEGTLGIFLYVTIGWYSRPEWVQFISQYGLTSFLFIYWYKKNHYGNI